MLTTRPPVLPSGSNRFSRSWLFGAVAPRIYLFYLLFITHNNFSFNSRHFLQVKGTAMGTCMAPSYANLFMGNLEQKFLGTQLDKPSLWLRFIDDIFLLWPHGPDSLTNFLKQLNSQYPVHFTWNTSPSHVTFLDVSSTIPTTSIPTPPTSREPSLPVGTQPLS